MSEKEAPMTDTLTVEATSDMTDYFEEQALHALARNPHEGCLLEIDPVNLIALCRAAREGVAARKERVRELELTPVGLLEKRLATSQDCRAILAAQLSTAQEENGRLREGLEIIAGRRQCLDNLMSNQEVALAALQTPAEEEKGND